MAHSSINAGVDFLYALLHGWWAHSAQGERLMTLTRSATEDNFFHQLQTMGIITISDPHQVHGALILRQHARLRKLGDGENARDRARRRVRHIDSKGVHVGDEVIFETRPGAWQKHDVERNAYGHDEKKRH